MTVTLPSRHTTGAPAAAHSADRIAMLREIEQKVLWLASTAGSCLQRFSPDSAG